MMGWLKRLFSTPSEWSLPVPCGYWASWAAEVAMDEGYEVHICFGPGRKLPHAQTRVKIDGRWEWVSVRNGKLEVVPCELREVEKALTPSVFEVCWVP